MRGHRRSVAGNPVLIGAATLLVVMVGVLLAYNANQGLPFVPTYRLELQVPSAANLVRGNDVRIGGTRVGAVSGIEAVRQPDGTTIAQVSVDLERAAEPLATDSTVLIRPKSVLGLKYVEITRGDAGTAFENGDVVPLENATPEPVEFDEVADTFDEPTREAAAENVVTFGDALAGRGQSLNLAIGALVPLLRDLEPVARNLASPRTGLRRFVRELSEAAAIVAPAAETQAALFVAMDRTFAALSASSADLQATIEEGPATLDRAVESFAVQRPFLANATGLFEELAPGVRSLRQAAPDLAAAVTAGAPALRRAVGLNRRLVPLLESLREFGEDPIVPRGVARLTDTMRILRPTLDFVAPAQTTCNYAATLFGNAASLLSQGDATGTWQRFIIISPSPGPDNEGAPSFGPADGPEPDNYLHSNPYPNTAAPGQPRECEAGNEPFLAGRTVIGNVPGTQAAATEGRP